MSGWNDVDAADAVLLASVEEAKGLYENFRREFPDVPVYVPGQLEALLWTDSMKRWYVVYTQARAEERALWHLQNQGFDCFLPRFRTTKRHARKTSIVLERCFPDTFLRSLIRPKAGGVRSTERAELFIC